MSDINTLYRTLGKPFRGHAKIPIKIFLRIGHPSSEAFAMLKSLI